MSTKINVNNAERLSSVLLGSALVSFGAVRRAGPLSLISIAGGAPLLWRGLTGNCPVYNALDINSASPEEINAGANAKPAGVPAGKGIKVSQHVTINKPPAEVFRFWSNFENLPRFMDHLESVKLHQNGCSHWVAKAPLGTKVEWDAEIVDAKVNEFISWRSKPGTSVPNEGTVRFKPTATGEGTEVEVTLEYQPPAGALGATLAKLFGEEPQIQVADDLRRFKNIMETGEVPTAGGQKVAASELPATPPTPAPNSEHHGEEPVAQYKQQLKQEAKEHKAETLDQAEVGSDLSFPASDPPTNY
ncbi:MAG TPA: SRPBCC family protein [Herpetosiphonaceae bacterium]|nr:SRPBCC family protein [Herpetosiphonaceae bacterium]